MPSPNRHDLLTTALSSEAQIIPVSRCFGVKPEPKDAGGKVRPWGVIAPSGTKLGCVTTKRGATKIAELLTLYVPEQTL